MEVRELKTLLVLMRDYGLVELEIEDKKGKVRLVRGGGRASVDATASGSPTRMSRRRAASPHQHGGAAPAAPRSGGSQGAAQARSRAESEIDRKPDGRARSTARPRPTRRRSSKKGSSVRKGQTLCIIEAMKMMNEIESPAAGRVIRILAENGNPIEYGQPLMIIEVI